MSRFKQCILAMLVGATVFYAPAFAATMDQVKQAAVEGNPKAQYMMGLAYRDGKGGFERDLGQAML